MIREKRVIIFSFFQQNLHLTREKIVRTFGTHLIFMIEDPKYFTMNRWVVPGSINDTYRYNPWRAPGAAPVEDACGTD